MTITEHLALDQGQSFEKNNIDYMKALPFVKTPQDILFGCYNLFVRLKRLKRIDDLPKEEREIIWATAKEYACEKLTREELIKLSKVLYVLECILNT